MKRFFYIFLIIALLLPGCSKHTKNPSISEPTLAKTIDSSTAMPLIPASSFNQSDPAIYFSVKVTDLPRGTKLKAVWKRLDDGNEVISEITTEGTRYEAFTLKRSGSQFPAGQYEVTVTATVDGRTLETGSKFTIQTEAKPTHLSNPVTAKSVDSDEKLNPADITAEFTQDDPVIYFIVQSKDLPKDTKVSCTWLYVDTGDSLSHEMITDGNRNIAFSLKPDPGQQLPTGRYIVTASVTINGQNESIWREFEIKEKK